MVVERGIAVSYKYNPLASVPVPEICVPVLCSRAQKAAVIVIKRKCRLIPDLPAPVAQLFVPGGSVDIMTNMCNVHSTTVRVSPMAVSLKRGEWWTEMFWISQDWGLRITSNLLV